MQKHLHEKTLKVALVDGIMVKYWAKDVTYPRRNEQSSLASRMEVWGSSQSLDSGLCLWQSAKDGGARKDLLMAEKGRGGRRRLRRD